MKRENGVHEEKLKSLKNLMEVTQISELKSFNFGTNINCFNYNIWKQFNEFFGTITKKLKENDLSSLETLSFILDKQKKLNLLNYFFFFKVAIIRLWKFQRLFDNVV